jgi:hypothetical protein
VEILNSNEDKLHLLAQALLEYETLTGDEIKTLMEGGQIDRPEAANGPLRPIATPAPPCPRQAAASPPGTAVFSRRAPEGSRLKNKGYRRQSPCPMSFG